MDSGSRQLLRHALATLAYRAGKTLKGASPAFASFECGPGSRTPVQILAHMGDLLDWALSLVQGKQVWRNSAPLEWSGEMSRFFSALQRLDQALASDQPLACTEEALLQGPIADALTHTGQLAFLRRVAGVPMRSENYATAEIVAGRVGPEQTAPQREFD